MRIPPLYKKPSWQRLFAGMVLGAIISWCIFLYTFGEWQEDLVTEIEDQAYSIEELKKTNKIYKEEITALNKINQEKLRVQSIHVTLLNGERYQFTTLNTYMIQDHVKEDISDVIAKDLESVYKSRKLLKKAIENKIYKIDDKQYKVEIEEMFIYTTLFIELKVSFAK
ncbi:sporulation membrane protein YtrI [Metabacillus idriensis]|uniref:sporulation membrane protein YtrI n=1 Tax=Metabacillus idriensis TaxID=324768 RepID=UPI00174AF313|nr:sporulation membrane protein YtrI [Metabacillus idriensis]